MFVCSVKMNRRWWRAVPVGMVALAAVLAVCLLVPRGGREAAGQAVSLRAETAAERVALLRRLGHEVDPESERVQELCVPEEPDATLAAYEALQPEGMSLLKYGGKRVKQYTYTVVNAQHDGVVKASVYVYRDRVVAGDVSAAGPDGFQTALVA